MNNKIGSALIIEKFVVKGFGYALAVVALLCTITPASAEDLFGGGSTFAAQAYVGNKYNLTSPKSRLSRSTTNLVTTTPIADFSVPTAPAPITVFKKYLDTFPGNAISYCQTGSGIGKDILIGSGQVINSNQECGNFSGSPGGFSGTFAAPDYVGTDFPITQADVNSFATSSRAGRGALVQFPSIVGTIAIPLNNNLSTYGHLDLSPAELCAIFSARVTNWSSIINSGSTGIIKIVYRSDRSGTTFAFTNYLTKTCNNQSFFDKGIGSFSIPANYFKPSENFTAAVPAVPGQIGSLAPYFASSMGVSGNPREAGTVNYTADAIGYADTAEVLAQGVNYAYISNQDPSFLPAAINIPTTSLLSGKVLDPSTVKPTAVTGTTQPQCLRLIDPQIELFGYPILAYTYIGAYYSQNGSKETAIENLMKFFYSPASRPVLPAGYAYIGNNAFATSVSNAIKSCIN